MGALLALDVRSEVTEKDKTADFAAGLLEKFRSLSDDMDGLERSLRALDVQLEGIQEQHDAVFDAIERATYQPIPPPRR